MTNEQIIDQYLGDVLELSRALIRGATRRELIDRYSRTSASVGRTIREYIDDLISEDLVDESDDGVIRYRGQTAES